MALARALVGVGPPGEGDDDVVLILDEPTNHLDIDAIAWLEERLAAHRGGLVLVSHDRHVLDRVTTRILELDRGRGYVHDGGYAGYLEARAEREEQAARRGGGAPQPGRAPSWPGSAGARRPGPASREPASTRRRRVVEGRPEAAARRGGPLDLAFGRPAARRHRRGAAGRRPPLRRGSVAVPGCRPGPRSPRAPRDRRPQRGRQVDAARRAGRPARTGRGPGGDREHRRAWGSTTSVAASSTRRCGSSRPSPARGGRPTGRTPGSWSGSGSTPTPSGRRSACCRAVSAAGCSWSSRCEPSRTCCCSTSRPTTSTSTRCGSWRTCSTGGPVRWWSSSHDRAFLERTVTDVLVLDERHPGRRVPGGYAAWEAERRSRRTAGRAVATEAARAPAGPPSRRASWVARPVRGPDRPATARRSPSTLRRLQREAEREVQALERATGRAGR